MYLILWDTLYNDIFFENFNFIGYLKRTLVKSAYSTILGIIFWQFLVLHHDAELPVVTFLEIKSNVRRLKDKNKAQNVFKLYFQYYKEFFNYVLIPYATF